MSIFPWKSKYSVYVESIDEQHKKLVDLLNFLSEEMSKGKAKAVLAPILDNLIDYTFYHFEEEEKYFEKIDYPNAEKHRAEHQQLIEDVLRFKTNHEAHKIGLTVELMKFLKEWLINHISGTDMDLGKLLNRSGIK